MKARLAPTLLTSIPLLTIYYFGFSDTLIGYIDFLKDFKWIGDLVLSTAIIFLLMQINRFISKELFQNIFFNGELKFPTTTTLLNKSKSLPEGIKSKIRDKIKETYQIDLLNQEDEEKDEKEARSTIVSAVGQIRNSLREDKMVKQHNIEYGFMRNFIGGSTLAVIASILGIYIFEEYKPIDLPYKICIGLCIFYSLFILLSKYILKRYAENYSLVLFNQFMALK